MARGYTEKEERQRRKIQKERVAKRQEKIGGKKRNGRKIPIAFLFFLLSLFFFFGVSSSGSASSSGAGASSSLL